MERDRVGGGKTRARDRAARGGCEGEGKRRREEPFSTSLKTSTSARATPERSETDRGTSVDACAEYRSRRRSEDVGSDGIVIDGARERERVEAKPPATLKLEYWTRDEETTRKKREHVDRLDDMFGYYGVEDHVERTVLRDADVNIETNMFPYETPRGVTHMTLWSRKEMTGSEIVRWTSAWLRVNRPRCVSWNFDMNENNSVDMPHYHVFTYEPPLERASGTRGAKRTRSCESVSDLTYVYDLSDDDETI